MSAVKNRPKRTPKVPFKIRSIQNGDQQQHNDSFDQGRNSSLSLASNGYEDISSDSNSSFDQTEFEQVYGPPAEWGCGRCGLQVHDSEEGVQCDGPCRSWVHTQCGNISPSSYRRMVKEEAEGRHCQWLCPGGTLTILYTFTWLVQTLNLERFVVFVKLFV